MNENLKSEPTSAAGRRGALFLLQIVVSLAALAWVCADLTGEGLNLPGWQLGSVGWFEVAGCYGLTAIIYGIRLWRLRLWTAAKAPRRLSATDWTDAYLKSIAFGSLTPARVGDFSRIAFLRRTGLDLGQRSRLVLLDKLTDYLYLPLALCLTAGMVAEKLVLPVWLAGAAAFVFFGGYLGGVWLLGRTLGLRLLLSGWAATAAAFVLFIYSNALLFWALSIDLSLLEITAIIVIVGVAASLPISLAGVGVREASLLVLVQGAAAPEQAALLIVLEFLLNIAYPILLYLIWVLLRAVASTGRLKNESA